MGCPSTENEFSAWSPSPWNRPFESATTPGVASFTSELTEDDWLSQWHPVRQRCVHVRMKTGVFLQQVPTIRFHRDAGCRRSDLQANLYCDRHARTHVHVLRVRAKSRSRHHQVVSIERHVRDVKRTIASRGGLPLVTGHGIADLDLRAGNHPAGRIFYHSLNRSSIAQLRLRWRCRQ